MTTTITVVYDNPRDPDAFEAGYPEQVALARKLPGICSLRSAKVWPKEDGSPTPAYRLLDLGFPYYESASAAADTVEAAAFFASVFQLGTGGVRIVFADIETE